jgi:4-aminobutyrate aminotransferase/(S)-3-amino-2-methylpropionate transaminase
MSPAPLPPIDDGTDHPLLRTEVPGPQGRALIDVLARHECPAITARRARRAEQTGVGQDPIVWDRARGANVWDADGNRFVDLTGGFGVASVGHGHPAVVAAVTEQAARLAHGLGDAFPARRRIELAAALAALTPPPLEQVIFASSGSEAVEAALKTAVVATGRGGIVAFEGGYHGMSLGALSASHYREAFRAPFADRVGPPATWLPWEAGEATVRDALARTAPAAVIVEPVQGRGGCRAPRPGWLGMLRRACDDASVLLVFDEIFTGFGRAGERVLSGTPAADGVVPDLLCVGKGLTSGYPLSACIGTVAAMGAWGASRGESLHTSTFLGHPVGCAAALAVIDLLDGGVLEQGRALGERMHATLADLAARHPGRLGGVTGRGAMRGLEVRDGASMTLCRALLERGYLVLPAGLEGEVIAFTPPLVTTHAQWDGAVAALEACL